MSRVIAAYHEAGHAVVGLALGFRILSVEVGEDGSGATSIDLRRDPHPIETVQIAATSTDDFSALSAGVYSRFTDDALVALVAQSMAGRMAVERIAPGTGAIGAACDFQQEQDTFAAMSDGPLPWDRARTLANSILAPRWEAVVAVALNLVARRRLTGDEVRAIIATERYYRVVRHG